MKSIRSSLQQSESKPAFPLSYSLLLAGSLLIGVSSHAAPAPTADEILKKAMHSSHPQNEEAVYKMRLISADNSETSRTMKVWFKSDDKDQIKLLIKFEEPANIRGTGFLTISENGKTPEQWLYLPSLKKSRRIVGGGSNESFLGSDFSVSDVSATSDANDSQSKLVGEKPCDGTTCYVVEVSPKAGKEKDQPYSKKVFYIQKDGFMTRKAEFYNTSKELEKVMTVSGIKKEGSQWLADSIEMKNVISNHRTIIEYSKRDTSKAPADHIFSKSNLEK